MKSYTLLDILNNKVSYLRGEDEVELELAGIKIPKIQRDYAQGRNNEKVIRNRFLQSLFKHLDSNESVMNLDFIYGSIKVLDHKNFFTPLDGQQRLTTLFLLNWYIASAELENEERNKFLTILSNFSYETRPVARKFCEKLCEFNFENEPVEEIKNENWFLNQYNLDPTISSMLIMIEAIDKLYKQFNHRKFFHRLSTIKFYVLPLDGFNLSDELYIKMNARGRQLSDFENFKADLVNWMKSEKNPDYEKFNHNEIYKEREVPYFLKIASKFDNEWSDIFWSANNEFNYDQNYLAFLTRFFLIHFVSTENMSVNDLAESEFFTSLTSLKKGILDYKYSDFQLFKEKSTFAIIKKLEKVLDNYYENKDFIHENISPLWDVEFAWLPFSQNIIPRQYGLFSGIVEYLSIEHFDNLKFKDWIRFVWNLIIKPEVRTFQAMISLIKNEIIPYSEYCADILTHLVSEEFQNKFKNNIINNNFETSILFQEIEKAKLILLNSELAKEIYELESHPMFKGHIAAFISFGNVEENINTLKNAAFLLCKDENGNLTKPKGYLWIRSILILNENLIPLLEKKPLTLKDGDFENWNILMNNELRTGFFRLLEKISKNGMSEIENVIKEFRFSHEDLWLWNLVKYELDSKSSLLKYSESKNIKYYENNIYLFYKTIWTESNIILSSYRNHLISKLLLIEGYKFFWEWGNIEDKFFRGWKPTVSYIYKGLKVSIVFYHNSIIIGISQDQIENISEDASWIDKSSLEDGFYSRKKIDFSDINSLEKVDKYVSVIDEYIKNTYH